MVSFCWVPRSKILKNDWSTTQFKKLCFSSSFAAKRSGTLIKHKSRLSFCFRRDDKSFFSWSIFSFLKNYFPLQEFKHLCLFLYEFLWHLLFTWSCSVFAIKQCSNYNTQSQAIVTSVNTLECDASQLIDDRCM